MKAAVFAGDRRVEIIDIPRPVPGPEEVLVQIKASGICGSDMKYYRTPASEVPSATRNLPRGHEPCGVVAELGPCARGVKVGDRVIVHHYKGCGVCKFCLTGWSQLCIRPGRLGYGYSAPGGHEEFGVFPDTACVPMPDAMSFEEGASCGCGTGTAYQALKRLAPSGLDTMVVFGQGPVGVAAVRIGTALGARVVAVDTVDERLALGKRFGAVETLNAAKVDVVAAIKEMTGGDGADCSIDCTGAAQARLNAVLCVRVWGRVCFVGEGGTVTFEPSPQIIHKHLTIYGSWTFSTHILAEAAKFISGRKLSLRETITHTFPLDQAEAAYRLFDTGTTGKIAILP
jgi:threonine dehydrogenase-like Zn-dependent dehydrogenase